MEEKRHKAITYLGILERTPEVPILYISSSVRDALLFEPSEVIGQSAKSFVANNGDVEELKKEHGSYSDDNILITKVIINRKDGVPVLLRTIAFACSNISFHLATAYPLATVDRNNERFSIQRFKCDLNEASPKDGEHAFYNGRSGASSSRTASSRTAGRNRYRNVINSIKKTRQACIVLEELKASNKDGSKGARIIFVTDSINRILDADSCDLKGMPFLSLVALEDITKAADFLDKALYSSALAVENLRLLFNPLEDSQLGYPKTVSMEFMAMGSDDGAIMLCQLKQPMGSDAIDGYMSLEDIISSDPETSDFVEM